MKTCFFCNLVPKKTGAFEQLLVQLAQCFKEEGDVITYGFAAEPAPAVAERLRGAGACWKVLDDWTDQDGKEHPWRFFRPAISLLRAEAPDVVAVHFGNELPSWVSSLTARTTGLGGIRWIWQQDQRIAAPSWLSRRISRLRLLLSTFTHFVAVYDGGRQSLLQRSIPPEKITVIFNGVAAPPPHAEQGWLRRELRLSGDAILAVSIGSLIPRKRTEFQIQGLARVRTAWPTLHLAIVGDGPERVRLEELVASLHLTDAVHFLGFRHDAWAILAESDVFVHTSIAEASSYAILESMAAGIPALVTASGAAAEQIQNGRSGFVVARDDLTGFAALLLDLARSRDLRQRLGQAARQRWTECYRVEDAARKYHGLYRRVAGIPAS